MKLRNMAETLRQVHNLLPDRETKQKEYQPSYDSPPLNVDDLHKWDLWAQAQKDEMQGMNKLYELQRWEQKKSARQTKSEGRKIPKYWQKLNRITVKPEND